MNNLNLRILTAAVIIVATTLLYYFWNLDGLFYGGLFFVSAGCFEFRRIASNVLKIPNKVLALHTLICLLVLFGYSLLTINPIVLISLSFILFWILTLLLTREQVKNEELLPILGLLSLGIIYTGFAPAFGVKLLQIENGLAWFLLLIFVVPAGDIFAYFAGIKFGKNKLMPSLSPKKTIEGAIGGLLGAVLLGLIIKHYFFTDIPLILFLPFCLLVSIAAQTGDLFESLLKRQANLKDSGKILPGHGGVLDRLDGFYFAGPIVYTMALYWKQLA